MNRLLRYGLFPQLSPRARRGVLLGALVCLLAGSYEQVEGLVRDHVRHLGPEQAAGFWGGNCARFYLAD